MSKLTADEFVHMTMAYADVAAKEASVLVLEAGGSNLRYLAARDDLFRHLQDSAAALQLEAFCDGVNHANNGWAGEAPMQGLAMFNRGSVASEDC